LFILINKGTKLVVAGTIRLPNTSAYINLDPFGLIIEIAKANKPLNTIAQPRLPAIEINELI
jgi:hypothetical protein